MISNIKSSKLVNKRPVVQSVQANPKQAKVFVFEYV